MNEDEVMIVLVGEPGLGFTAPMNWAGEAFIFEPGVPQRVPRALAESLVSNNPQPWQTGGFATYRVVDRSATGGKD